MEEEGLLLHKCIWEWMEIMPLFRLYQNSRGIGTLSFSCWLPMCGRLKSSGPSATVPALLIPCKQYPSSEWFTFHWSLMFCLADRDQCKMCNKHKCLWKGVVLEEVAVRHTVWNTSYAPCSVFSLRSKWSYLPVPSPNCECKHFLAMTGEYREAEFEAVWWDILKEVSTSTST